MAVDRGHGGRVFRDVHGGRGAAAVRRDGRRIVVDVGDGDGDVLGIGVGAVGHLHLHVVDVVGAGIGRDFGVGCGDEGQHAGGGIDGELGGVGAARDRISQDSAGVRVGRRNRRDGRRVLRDVDGCGGTAAVRRDRRGIVVDAGDGDGDVLRVGVAAIGHLHLDVVDVVGAGVGRDLGIRRGDEGQDARRGIDRELGGVGAADDAVGQRRAGVRVGRGHRGDGSRVLRDVDRCRRPAPVRCDHGGIVAQVDDRDGDILSIGVRAVRHLHLHVVDVVGAGVGRELGIGGGHERQDAGGGIDGELGGVGATHDGIGQGRAGIGVRRNDRCHRRAALRHVDGRGGTAAVRRDHGGVVVDVGDGDRDVLGVGVGAVGHLHLDVVDVVAAGVGRRLGVRSGDERQARRSWH